MIRKTTILIFLMFIAFAEAQIQKHLFQIAGQVTERKNNKSVPYATVTLQNDSTKLIRRISCDATGNFTFAVKEKSKYKLIISAVGFKGAILPVDINGAKTDVGSIKLDEGAALKEVTVMGQKPLVKMDPDKITYNVAADPDSRTNNALEILRKVPLINLDGQENVTLKGQPNFLVLVNGKKNPLVSKNLNQVLRSLPANSIKSIEVITHPSSKYEAENIEGIINIITIDGGIRGYNGSINAGANTHKNANATLYIASRVNEKTIVSGSYCESKDKEPESGSEGFTRNDLSTDYRNTTRFSRRERGGRSYSFSGDLSYEIDSLSQILFSVRRIASDYDNEAYSRTDARNALNQPSRFFENYSNGKSDYADFSASINYEKSFKKPGKLLSVSYFYEAAPDKQNSLSGINKETAFNYTPYSQRSVMDNKNDEHYFQIDYVNPLSKKHKIEFGIKGVNRNNNNNSDYYRNDTLITERNNDVDHTQYILSTYGLYVFKLKKFSARFGYRIENEWNDARLTTDTAMSVSSRFLNLVPNLALFYQLKENSKLSISYRQGLRRPGIWDLNPYVDRRDPLNLKSGNPNLTPEKSHLVNISYDLSFSKWYFSNSLSGSVSNNAINSITTINAAGVSSTTKENIGKSQALTYYGDVSYYSGKLQVRGSAGSGYRKYESFNLGKLQTNEGVYYSLSLSVYAGLWKNGRMSADGNYSSSSYSVQSKSSGNYYCNFSLTQSFFRKKLSVTFGISEPFRKKFNTTTDTQGNGYESHSENYSYARKFRLRAIYTFGKTSTNVRNAKKPILNDDRTGKEIN